MKMEKSSFIFKILLLVIAFGILNINAFGLIMGNYSESTICKDCESKTAVRTRVVNGGAYFLNAYAEILLFLQRIEVSETQTLDYNELGEILGRARESLNRAESAYRSLVALTDVIPLDPVPVRRLQEFDYDSFREENRLNRAICREVAGYLSKGDVRGFFRQVLARTVEIASKLEAVATCIDNGKFPELACLWSLNQACSETLLFGQYAAAVFFTVK
jgi:hypothetical protein